MFRHIRKHTKPRPGIVATLAIAITLGLGRSGTAAATAPDNHDPLGPNPTIVFVHGAWADSSGWNQEITNLERRGYPVIAPANPLRGLASDASYIHSVLQTLDGPIVLVGHSYGGAVISFASAWGLPVPASRSGVRRY
jgi:pimeloyl-ACP methyl ester carboxylesterase